MTAISSIPTQYKDIQFRSRFEAGLARIFDEWAIDWQYEPQSFLLENGVHYWPDFYLPLIEMWVEVRGYVSEKGEAQIAQFAKQLKPGHRFMVVRGGTDREIFNGPACVRPSESSNKTFSKEIRLWAAAMKQFDLERGVRSNVIMHKYREDGE